MTKMALVIDATHSGLITCCQPYVYVGHRFTGGSNWIVRKLSPSCY